MSNNNDDEPEVVKISKRDPKLTPPGITIQLSVQQSVLIAEFVDSPVYKILTGVYLAQRKDHLARTNLNLSHTSEQVAKFRGMAEEAVLFFRNMEAIKKAVNSKEDKE